jgi:DNA-binding transcriptional MerR regulator
MKGAFYRPADIAKVIDVHPNTIRNVAQRLNIQAQKTASGYGLFSEEEADRVIFEIQRRRRERAAEMAGT